MFDMDKVMAGDSNTVPDELLKQTFFTTDGKVTENSLEKHGFDKKLRKMLSDSEIKPKDVLEYLKSLTPSGIELEFISLASFDFEVEDKNRTL